MTRIVFVSDLHCGSAQSPATKPTNSVQRAMLARFKDAIAHVGQRPDVLVVNGDSVDGQDPKTRDVENDDVPWQVEEAAALIAMWQPKSVAIVEGTPYHAGASVQLERFLAGYLDRNGIPTTYNLKYHAKVNGWFKLQSRHKIGRSMVPYGVHTAPQRSQMWQTLNAAIEARQSGAPVTWPHLSVFGHVHYWSYAESAMGASVTLPCWKALGDRYGTTQCDGHVDVGLFWCDIGKTEKEGWTWERRLYPARVVSQTVTL